MRLPNKPHGIPRVTTVALVLPAPHDWSAVNCFRRPDQISCRLVECADRKLATRESTTLVTSHCGQLLGQVRDDQRKLFRSLGGFENPQQVFEEILTAGYDVQSAGERELMLRLGTLSTWLGLRPLTAIPEALSAMAY